MKKKNWGIYFLNGFPKVRLQVGDIHSVFKARQPAQDWYYLQMYCVTSYNRRRASAKRQRLVASPSGTRVCFGALGLSSRAQKWAMLFGG